MILTPPKADLPGTTTDESVYKNIQMFQARNSMQPREAQRQRHRDGQDSAKGVGTMYFPAAKYELGGTNNQFNVNSIIAKNIEVYGTGDIHVTRGYETTRWRRKDLPGRMRSRNMNKLRHYSGFVRVAASRLSIPGSSSSSSLASSAWRSTGAT